LIPFSNEVLVVTDKSTGKKLQYQGRVVDFVPNLAAASNVVTLPPKNGDGGDNKHCISADVDLSLGYSYHKDLTYNIQAKYDVVEATVADQPAKLPEVTKDSEKKFVVDGKNDKDFSSKFEQALQKDPLKKYEVVKTFKLESPTFELKLKHDYKLSVAELEKRYAPAASTAVAQGPGAPLPPAFLEVAMMKMKKHKRARRARTWPQCSQAQKNVIEAAAATATTMVATAIQYLGDKTCSAKQHLIDYFHDASKNVQISTKYTNVQGKIPNVAVECATGSWFFGLLGDSNCGSNTIAYTYANNAAYNTIHLCPTAFETGWLPGTIVHECSHLDPTNNDDLGQAYYGRAGAKKAAGEGVDRAFINAANYQWFAYDAVMPC